MEQLTNLLLAVVIVGYVFNFIYKKMNRNTVISKIDNRSYEVRKLPDSQDAADKLAVISERLTQLVEQVTRNTPGGKYTAYSVNKGEQLALCLRDDKDDTFIELNLIIFVAIHEIAHVMTDEVGHTDKFWANMKYLLEQGVKTGIYTPEDYSKNPKKYCDMDINSTPYKFN